MKIATNQVTKADAKEALDNMKNNKDGLIKAIEEENIEYFIKTGPFWREWIHDVAKGNGGFDFSNYNDLKEVK